MRNSGNSIFHLIGRCMGIDLLLLMLLVFSIKSLPDTGLFSRTRLLGVYSTHPVLMRSGLTCLAFSVRRATLLCRWMTRGVTAAATTPPSSWRLFPYVGGSLREIVLPMHTHRMPPSPHDEGWTDRSPRLIAEAAAWSAPLLLAAG